MNRSRAEYRGDPAYAEGATTGRPGTPTLWAIKRSTSQALGFTVPYRSITDPKASPFQVLGPGHFQR